MKGIPSELYEWFKQFDEQELQSIIVSVMRQTDPDNPNQIDVQVAYYGSAEASKLVASATAAYMQKHAVDDEDEQVSIH